MSDKIPDPTAAIKQRKEEVMSTIRCKRDRFRHQGIEIFFVPSYNYL